jgi:hypothetical protein
MKAFAGTATEYYFMLLQSFPLLRDIILLGRLSSEGLGIFERILF